MIIHFPTWYEQVLESRKFWNEFVNQVEAQISSIISAYKTGKDVVTEADDYTGQEYYLEHYKGFDDGTYDVADLFKVYFPNLHRRSSLITLYSFLEFELNKLCEDFKRTKNLELSIDDLKGDGIVRASNYLVKVVI